MGTMIMRLRNPHSLSFLVRVNNTSRPVTVNAFGPTGERLPAEGIARSTPVLYPTACSGCVQFREEMITVSNAPGISRIEVAGGAYLLMVDEVRVSP